MSGILSREKHGCRVSESNDVMGFIVWPMT